MANAMRHYGFVDWSLFHVKPGTGGRSSRIAEAPCPESGHSHSPTAAEDHAHLVGPSEADVGCLPFHVKQEL
jgi:hypothetical protein